MLSRVAPGSEEDKGGGESKTIGHEEHEKAGHIVNRSGGEEEEEN